MQDSAICTYTAQDLTSTRTPAHEDVFYGLLSPVFARERGKECWETLLWRAGPCARCEMVCTDQELGRRGGPEPLLTLAAYRRTRGRIHFGVLLDHTPVVGSADTLTVGAAVSIDEAVP